MMKRLFLTLLVVSMCLPRLEAQVVAEPIRIWEGTPVHARNVTLTPYLPDGAWGVPAVIVCPGGSYFWLDIEHEGRMVAEWLCQEGIAAFLLQYRTGGWFDFTFRSRAIFGGNQHPDMISDLQRSLQLVRENWEVFGIDPSMVGAMGFSAGGHLVMSSAEFFGTDFLAPQGVSCQVSLRPDFVAPIYPVVTLEDREFVHSRSRRGLLGVDAEKDAALRDLLSAELHVSDTTPPVFLLNCLDDPVVDFRNSVVLDSALTANKVPHSYVQYQIGGHGFGADPQKFGAETARWQEAFLRWFKMLFADED